MRPFFSPFFSLSLKEIYGGEKLWQEKVTS